MSFAACLLSGLFQRPVHPKAEPRKMLLVLKGGEEYAPPEEPLYINAWSDFGYMDVKIGTVIGDFQVVRKLGWARYSSVWLCIDLRSPPPMSYVALKVITTYGSAYLAANLSAEYEVLSKVRSANPSHPGFKHCLAYLDVAFEPMGGHQCIATEPLGSNLENLRSAQRKQRFSVQITKRIVKQVLLALDYLHRECGYTHADVKLDNLVVCPPDLAQGRIKCLLSKSPVERYDPINISTLSPDPIITIRSQPLPNFGLKRSLQNLNIKLIDYGEAKPVKTTVVPGQKIQAEVYRAPEVVMELSWSPAMDIWSVGCMLFECLTSADLFSQSLDVPWSPFLHLQQMEELLGPFPPSLVSSFPTTFDENGRFRNPTNFTSRRLEDLLPKTRSPNYSTAQFIRRCLTLDPKTRPDARELLEDVWLKDV
ncbi:kinase-like domain-containing protein [Mycena alexandri]|uniref:Kinase-like domain-containing protein n=1 Tax=Mycena alexandri TaxID=1745969 RepID=A0AAD6SK01_9AGAR|nr:kinase-like domain-containing protein [Mycena alexandri]